MFTIFINKYGEIIRYLIVGVLTTAVSWGIYWILKHFMNVEDPVQMQIAVILRWFAGVLFSFFASKYYVFRSENPHVIREFIEFSASRVVTLLTDMGAMWLLVNVIGLNDWVSTLISSVIVVILNYVFSKVFVFTKK